MLHPTVHESNYCSHHPHRRLEDQSVFLRFSQWWRTLPITYQSITNFLNLYIENRDGSNSLTHIQSENVLMHDNCKQKNPFPNLQRKASRSCEKKHFFHSSHFYLLIFMYHHSTLFISANISSFIFLFVSRAFSLLSLFE